MSGVGESMNHKKDMILALMGVSSPAWERDYHKGRYTYIMTTAVSDTNNRVM